MLPLISSTSSAILPVRRAMWRGRPNNPFKADGFAAAQLKRWALLRHQGRHMEHMKTLTSQQLVIAAGGSLLVASVMLSHGNNLGFLLLALAVACGIGAFAKSKKH